MKRFIAYALCTALMLGVFGALRFAIYGVSDGFGDGFFAGAMTMIVLFWSADHILKRRH